MDYLKLENGDWIVVCDGKKALFLENVGTGEGRGHYPLWSWAWAEPS